MKKIVTVLLILVMVTALASCGKSEEKNEPAKTEEATKTPEATKTSEVTKEAEETPKPEVTKKAEVTEAPEATDAPEVTEAPEVTDEPEVPTATPEPVTPEPTEAPDINEEDEFYSAGHVFEGTYQSDQCTLVVVPEGAADIFLVYNGNNINKEEWEEWLELWTNYSESDKTFSADGGYKRYQNGEKDYERLEEQVSFVVSGDKLVWTSNGNMEFAKVSGSDDPEGNEAEDDEFNNPAHVYCGTWSSEGCTMELIPEGYAIIVKVAFGEDAASKSWTEWEEYSEYWVEFFEEDMTLLCDGDNYRAHFGTGEDGVEELYEEDPTCFVIENSGSGTVISWPDNNITFNKVP